MSLPACLLGMYGTVAHDAHGKVVGSCLSWHRKLVMHNAHCTSSSSSSQALHPMKAKEGVRPSLPQCSGLESCALRDAILLKSLLFSAFQDVHPKKAM